MPSCNPKIRPHCSMLSRPPASRSSSSPSTAMATPARSRISRPKPATQPSPCPPVKFEIAEAIWDQPEPSRSTVSIADAIERLAYDLLAQTHCGWENNDGAYGDFTFDVAERTITLDYNERYTASEYSQHVF